MRIARHALPLLLVLLVAGAVARIAFARSSTTGTGVVVINTNLGYQQNSAAGTGMVLTSSGEILTNNHVIAGATSIRVTLPGTGRTYVAHVVGYNVSRDVAVIQAVDASNLKTVSVGGTTHVGQKVKALGNAGGTGAFTPAIGTVTGVGKTITANNDQGGSEQLAGLIETNAALEPGDSGGPLYDLSGRVVGMDTAASTSNEFGFQETAASDAYAIPIARALAVVQAIESGDASASVHIGATAFLGVEVQSADAYDSSGALIAGVVPGGPADKAGLRPGDIITSIGGRTVTSPLTVSSLLQTKKPGATIHLTIFDGYDSSHTVSVKLASGPPQ